MSLRKPLELYRKGLEPLILGVPLIELPFNRAGLGVVASPLPRPSGFDILSDLAEEGKKSGELRVRLSCANISSSSSASLSGVCILLGEDMVVVEGEFGSWSRLLIRANGRRRSSFTTVADRHHPGHLATKRRYTEEHRITAIMSLQSPQGQLSIGATLKDAYKSTESWYKACHLKAHV